MFDGKGLILVRLRRFPQITDDSLQNPDCITFQYKTNMLVNIKGAYSLAVSLLTAITTSFISEYFTTEEYENSLGFYVQNINCIGYDEFSEDELAMYDKQIHFVKQISDNFDVKLVNESTNEVN